MRDQQMLPPDLRWRDDGHVTDVVLDTLADGQDEVVPTLARDHVNACDLCSQRLGEAAMLTLRVGVALRQVVNGASAASPRPGPIPIPALVVAVLIAAIASIPAVGNLVAGAADMASTVIAIVPNLARAVVALSHAGVGDLRIHLAILSMISVAILIASGLAIARVAPREAPANGGEP